MGQMLVEKHSNNKVKIIRGLMSATRYKMLHMCICVHGMLHYTTHPCKQLLKYIVMGFENNIFHDYTTYFTKMHMHICGWALQKAFQINLRNGQQMSLLGFRKIRVQALHRHVIGLWTGIGNIITTEPPSTHV